MQEFHIIVVKSFLRCKNFTKEEETQKSVNETIPTFLSLFQDVTAKGSSVYPHHILLMSLILHSPGLSGTGIFERSRKVKSLGFVMEEAVDSRLTVCVPGFTVGEGKRGQLCLILILTISLKISESSPLCCS